MILNGRWRGKMPYRRARVRPVTLQQQERGGESLPVSSVRFIIGNRIAGSYGWPQPPGAGKARGSFTEKWRIALHAWMKNQHTMTVTFKYRLYRHRVITVTCGYPYIYHDPNAGSGRKVFMLRANVLSIDGVRPAYGKKVFAVNRIVAGEAIKSLLALESGDK